MLDQWHPDSDYRKRWSQYSYLRIAASRPGSDKVVSVTASIDPDPFFGFIGQLGSDVLGALQIFDGTPFHGFDQDEGVDVDVLEALATISLKRFQMEGRIILQKNGNATILFGDFLRHVPLELNFEGVPNFSLLGGAEVSNIKRVFLS